MLDLIMRLLGTVAVTSFWIFIVAFMISELPKINASTRRTAELVGASTFIALVVSFPLLTILWVWL